MQELKAQTLFNRVTGGKACGSMFALCLVLAACQAPQAESAAKTEQAPASAPVATTTTAATAQPPAPQTPSSQTEMPAAEQDASSKTAADAPTTDKEGNPYRPDDSYNRANLRPEFKKCAAASDAVTSAMQACADEEFLWQQKRMRAALATIDAGPDSEFKDKLGDEQAAYMRDTNRYCRFDPATQGQGQMLDAQSCRINRYANRADALEALISK
ncbi:MULTISPECIES: lysozyme inhibitor LprI family protein [Xanthomonas]|uniref:lysozyme inhibitor LprI family protein n=1 Tax=Xanthomonas TaxID=338 RepID=UPI000E1F6BC8|nr:MULTISPECIES: lysozyme inhibitor LprI family protein [Xanthomonas]